MKRVALVLAVLAPLLLLFWPYLLQHRIPLNGDWLEARFLPWSAHPGLGSANAELDDPIIFQYPLRLQGALTIRRHEWPGWNPAILCGTPLFEDQASMPLCPFNLLMVVLPPLDGWTWLLFGELAVAGLGMAWLLDDFGLPRPACLLGAVSFMLCSVFGQSLEWPSYLGTYGWLPWIALGVERMHRGRRGGAPLAALAMGLQFWCGMVQLCMYVMGAAVGLMVVRLVQGRGRQLVPSSAVLLVALGLGAVVLLPTAHLLGEAARSAVKYLNWARPAALLTYLWPDVFGHPARGDYVPVTGLYLLAFSGYIGLWSGCLALSGWRRDARRLPYQLLTLPLPLYILMTALPAWRNALASVVPFLFTVDHLRSAGVYAFAVSVLAAFGMADVLAGDRRRLFVRSGLAGGAAILLVGVLEYWPGAGLLPAYFASLRATWGDALLSPNLLWPEALWVGFLVWSGGLAGRRPQGWALGVVVVVAADLLRGVWAWNLFVPVDHIYPPHPALTWLQDHVGGQRILALEPPDAIRGRSGLLPPDSALPYGLRDVRGYDSIWVNRYALLEGPPRDNWFHSIPNPDWPVASLLGVRYLLSRDAVESSNWKLVFQDDIRIYENQRPCPRAFVVYGLQVMAADDIRKRLQDPAEARPQTLWVEPDEADRLPAPAAGPSGLQPATIVRDGSNTVSISTDTVSAGYLVLADTMYDGWTATLDGQSTPVVTAYTALRTVAVPAGHHQVDFFYRPARIYRAAALSLVSLLALALWAIVVGFPQRRIPPGTI